ncbi:MAG: type II CAAX endopeptidase family protein [Chthoniobacterales bacterium]
MRADGVLPALSFIFYVFFLISAVYIYGSLVFQISWRETEPSLTPPRGFGWPEAILAFFFALLFLAPVLIAPPSQTHQIQTRDLITNALVTMGMLLAVAGFLRLRRFDLNALGGFSKIGFFRTVVTGAVLMLAAYPLIFFADFITQRVVSNAPRKQEIVELFSGSSTLEQRVVIIILAISIAPLVEEFIFRFFLYGVLKRYFGRSVGVIVSSLLFAAVHAHLPSFGPLFVLGTCFAIAYEWSGSLLVSMTMHALFNAMTLTALAFPERFQP